MMKQIEYMVISRLKKDYQQGYIMSSKDTYLKRDMFHGHLLIQDNNIKKGFCTRMQWPISYIFALEKY